jgi:CHAT domain-containing protein
MYEASLHAGKARGVSAEDRRTAGLNAAHAAIIRSYGDDSPDGLVEAIDELRRCLDFDPPDDWLELLSAAADLVNAVSAKADKHGDLSGYPAALQLLADVAHRMPPDAGSMAFVHERRAEYHATLWDRLPPGAEADGHAAEAVAAARAAIAAVTPSIRDMLPGLHADLGFLLARVQAGPGGLEAGIAECRTAVALARRSPRARAAAWRSLATLLVDYARELDGDLPAQAPDAVLAVTASGVDAVLAEAERIARWARWCGGFDGRVAALALLARVRTTRAVLWGSPGQDRRATRAWRRLARAAVRSDPLNQVQIGQDWADWAEATQELAWCAEAYAYLMSGVPRAVAVRYLAGERDKILADLQSTAEEAGYWLAQAGRLGDAAVALELGRAVSLSEVLGREWPGLAALLTRAGRPDLLERYRQALKAYSAATASALDGDDLTSAAQRAWASYDTVAREIAAVADVDLPGVRLTPAELAAAAAEGPVVYLAAAARGGYAIIVSPAGPSAYLPLPQLTRAAAADLAESLLREPESGRDRDRAKIAAAARRLWTAGIGMLAAGLPAGALVTLIPMGLLSLLPLHAAGGPAAPGQAPEDWEFFADRVTVRYAPNARTLLSTRHRAGALAQVPLTLLAVAAPDADQQASLPYTVREVTEIARRWTQPKLITDGASAALAELSGDDTVWHLACHCSTVPDHILDSALLLSHAQVTLREILAMPSVPRRLAVLSACNTHVSGTELPDEAMGLPAGLLHAGFAGVIASHWAVSDQSTAFLMIRFHDLWHGQGLPPAVALAEAQRWLRGATRAELQACLHGRADLPASQSAERSAQREAVRPYRHRPYAHPYHWAPFALTGQ